MLSIAQVNFTTVPDSKTSGRPVILMSSLIGMTKVRQNEIHDCEAAFDIIYTIYQSKNVLVW